MNHEYASQMSWNNGRGMEHQIDLDIQLALPELLKGRNIAVELITNQEALRRDIFSLVSENILPAIIQRTGVSSIGAEGGLNTKNTAHTEGMATIYEDKDVSGTIVGIRNRLKVTMKITADRPVNAMEALRASIGNMAAVITDDVIHNLRYKFLGIRKNRSSSDASFSNGKLTDYKARQEGSAPSGN